MRKATLTAVLATALVAMGFGPGLTSATASDTVVTTTLAAVSDSYVSQSNPTAAHATSTYLGVCPATCGTKTSSERRAFVRFSVPALPTGATGAKYVLQMTPTTTYSGTVTAHSVSNSWSDKTLVWGNQPAIGVGLDTKSLSSSAATSASV